MTYKQGIDVSHHQGNIKWEQVAAEKSFAIIRAGYGSSGVDRQFAYNAHECERLKIPYGIYWFSYARNESEAYNEARECIDVIAGCKPQLGVFYDYESASEYGTNVPDSTLYKIYLKFVQTIQANGYTPGIYCDLNYYKRGAAKVATEYKTYGRPFTLWIAHWVQYTEAGLPDTMDYHNEVYDADILQYSSKGRIKGITGDVDLNITTTKIIPSSDTTTVEDIREAEDLSDLKNRVFSYYTSIAKDVIAGKYGNGDERKKKLKEINVDAEIIQIIVNFILKNEAAAKENPTT